MPKKLFMKNFKSCLIVIFLSIFYLNASNASVYEYEIRFKNKIGPFSLDGLKTFSKKEKGFSVTFKGENKLLNAEILQESQFSLTNLKVFPNQYSQEIKLPIKGKQNQYIDYDYKDMKIVSSGDVNWVIDFSGNKIPLDPISSGFQIRQNLKMGIEEFALNLIKLDEGTFKENNFKVIGEEILSIKDIKYPCKVVERTDEKGGKSLYYIAETLDFILIKVSDERKERKISIEAEKILSFG
tara:strand:+ start:338 stop:1057 length:720 start_codon:yes stop_codon:yes gene_type:complete